MSPHPITTPASPSPASPHFDASCVSIESLTTSFATSAEPTLETTTVTEVALGYHRNQQYSITTMTTSTGAVAERYAYTAYGQPTICNASGSPIGNEQSQIANRFTYTGREWDETIGLHHFRASWMSPLAGRFLGRDPIGYVDGLNISNFIVNRALSLLDAYGMKKHWDVTTCGCWPDHWFDCCRTNKPGPPSEFIVYRRDEFFCFDGQVYKRNRSDSECCAHAKAVGIDQGDWGAVVCCGGRKVSCSWMPPTTDPGSTRILNECTIKRENEQHDGVLADGNVCNRKTCLARDGFFRGSQLNAEECRTYTIEWHCLRSKMAKCQTSQCRVDVSSEMARILLFARNTYGGCDVTLDP